MTSLESANISIIIGANLNPQRDLDLREIAYICVERCTMVFTSQNPTPLNFDRIYQDLVLNNHFFENPSYYIQQKPRYKRVLGDIQRLPLPPCSSLLEIGGGQIALLSQALLGTSAMVADLNDTYKSGLLHHGLRFHSCDLLHDDLPVREAFDIVVMCEVIEHLPIPPYLVLTKIQKWIKPGGWIYLTTPNLYRLRNLVRMLLGARVFDLFYMPERGQGIGHPLEYSASHLQWQLEKSGFEHIQIQLSQLDNAGASPMTQFGRMLATPLLLRPLWRDKLVAIAQKPFADP
jgi:SAM-dependent methyltransferase